MDVPGRSCSPGWASVRVMHALGLASRSALSAAGRVLMVFYLFVLIFYKNGNYSYKTGVGVVIFSWKVARLLAKRKGMLHKACWQ